MLRRGVTTDTALWDWWATNPTIDVPAIDGAYVVNIARGAIVDHDNFDDDTTVYPGHMGVTTLGAERATNPFLARI